MGEGVRMRYALVDGKRQLPEKGVHGICPVCRSEVFSKCGDILTHQWQHKSKEDCDSWSEGMGEWHLGWQACVPEDCREVAMAPHRADVVGKNRCVVELQQSQIPSEQIAAREKFYDNMVWLFEGVGRFEFITAGRRVFFSLGNYKHLQLCKKPVFIDFGNTIVEVESFNKSIPRLSGYGHTRSRQWFADQFLYDKSPVNLSSNADKRWSRHSRYETTPYASKWNDAIAGVLTIPKNSLCIPLELYRKYGSNADEWEWIIDEQPALANGWTVQCLRSMKELLCGNVMILDGLIRLMPSPAAQFHNEYTSGTVEKLIGEMEVHIAAGRIPILQESAKQKLREAPNSRNVGTITC